MPIKINDDFTVVEIGGSVIAIATRASNGRRTVDGWPGRRTRDRAIAALVLADRLAAGYGDDGRLVTGWRQELR